MEAASFVEALRCPVCSGPAAVVEMRRAHRRAECATCGVRFCHPFGAAGRDWYEEVALYGAAAHPVTDLLEASWEQSRVALQLRRDDTVLDVGCGGGTFLRAAAQRCARVSGIDVQERQLAWARDLVPSAELAQLTLDAFVAREPSRRFDWVTAFHVLEHLDQPAQFLSIMRGRVRPGGRVAIAVPNRHRLPISEEIEALDVPPHHVTYWDRGALVRALSSAGFEDVEVEAAPIDTFGPLTRLLSSGFMRRALGRADRPTGDVAIAPAVDAGMQAAPTAAIRLYQVKLGVIRALARVPNLALRAAGAEGQVLLATGVRRD